MLLDALLMLTQGFMRFLHARQLLRTMCRQQYTRLYSSRYKAHYYCFMKNGKVSFSKYLNL
jgi:hypothetical protein